MLLREGRYNLDYHNVNNITFHFSLHIGYSNILFEPFALIDFHRSYGAKQCVKKTLLDS